MVEGGRRDAEGRVGHHRETPPALLSVGGEVEVEERFFSHVHPGELLPQMRAALAIELDDSHLEVGTLALQRARHRPQPRPQLHQPLPVRVGGIGSAGLVGPPCKSSFRESLDNPGIAQEVLAQRVFALDRRLGLRIHDSVTLPVARLLVHPPPFLPVCRRLFPPRLSHLSPHLVRSLSRDVGRGDSRHFPDRLSHLSRIVGRCESASKLNESAPEVAHARHWDGGRNG
mmetsp:Transcript_16107/g.38828  ORF Transcript_16107/g.38828 Transcript_16107/m.38828 type:complete len:229 (-) Transcript_16107:177-863(-)